MNLYKSIRLLGKDNFKIELENFDYVNGDEECKIKSKQLREYYDNKFDPKLNKWICDIYVRQFCIIGRVR